MTYSKRAFLCVGILVLAQVAISQASSGSKKTTSTNPTDVRLVIDSQIKPAVKPNNEGEGWQDFGLSLLPQKHKAPKPYVEQNQESDTERVANAMHLRGSRYRYGGLSSRSGFDCSGFVKIVLSEEGINLPRTSGQQATVGVPVKGSDLKPGDLVFFHTSRRSRITHVGIYAGDGKFIHAANERKGVRVDSLSEKYYRKRLVTARRVSGK